MVNTIGMTMASAPDKLLSAINLKTDYVWIDLDFSPRVKFDATIGVSTSYALIVHEIIMYKKYQFKLFGA